MPEAAKPDKPEDNKAKSPAPGQPAAAPSKEKAPADGAKKDEGKDKPKDKPKDAPAPAAKPDKPAKAPAPPPGSAGKLVIADDVTPMRTLLARALTNAGYAVAEARNGQEVLDHVAKSRPDLIILDGMMPMMSGPECLEKLKASPDTANIPVIMCTAKSEKQDVIEAAKGGAIDYIVKPFRIEVVLERVAKHMPKK